MSFVLPYREARSRALFRELDANPSLLLLGGAIALPFNPDDGLLERYADRIVWPPISEFSTAGIGVGAAMAGLRPLVAVSTASADTASETEPSDGQSPLGALPNNRS